MRCVLHRHAPQRAWSIAALTFGFAIIAALVLPLLAIDRDADAQSNDTNRGSNESTSDNASNTGADTDGHDASMSAANLPVDEDATAEGSDAPLSDSPDSPSDVWAWVNANWVRIAWATGILALALIVSRIILGMVKAKLISAAERSGAVWDDFVLKALYKPIGDTILVVGIYAALVVALEDLHNGDGSGGVLRILNGALGVALALILIWAGWRISNAIEPMVQRKTERDGTPIDKMIVPFVRRGVRIVILAVGVSMIIEACGGSVAGLITALGVGGIAVALAAKDLLANLIASVMIFASRPFKIGDVVTVSDTTGTVSRVGLRATVIKTFDRHDVVIPNQDIANGKVRNISARNAIRNYYTVKLAYDTPPDALRKTLDGIRDLLAKRDDVEEYAPIRFTGFGDYALEVQILYVITTTDWDAYQKATEEVNLAIMDVLAANKTPLAPPTQSVAVHGELASAKA